MSPAPPFPIPQAFALALEHHQAGRLGDAEALYRQILAARPNDPQALMHLGVIAHQVGRDDLAMRLIRQSLSILPANFTAWMSLGVILAHQGQHAEATSAFRRALQIQPNSPEACTRLGDALQTQGLWNEAIAACRRAIALNPDSGEACNIMGMAFAGQKQMDEAVDAYRRALGLRPEDAAIHNNLGAAFIVRKEFAEAVNSCQRAIQLAPDFAGAWTNLGTALGDCGRFDEAVAAYRRALVLNPNLADLHYNLSVTLADRGLFHEAIIAARRALELNPNSPNIHNNLGVILVELGRFDEAVACYQNALALDPRYSDAHLNIAVVLCFQGRFHESEPGYRRAVACDPESPKPHLSLSVLLLLLGRYEEGWREYEWRSSMAKHGRQERQFSAPRWNGAPAPGKRILIHAEQGFGDTLQLLRYLPIAHERAQGAQLILECQPGLFSLLGQLRSPDLEIVAPRTPAEALPPFDLHLPLFSLPGVLRCHEPVPINTPYLQADPALRAQWRERLGPASGLKIGLVWAGNPKHDNDRRRSIAPEKLLPLFRLPGIRFASLQISPSDPKPNILATEGLIDFRPHLTDFSETAALIAELDLIVTVDTAVAHLAGVLGRPVWVLIPFVPDWRWGLDREDAPWYPTMRLFRQTRVGDWEDVLARVTAALRDRLA